MLALPLGGTLSPKNRPGVSTGGRPQGQTARQPRVNTSSGPLEQALLPATPFPVSAGPCADWWDRHLGCGRHGSETSGYDGPNTWGSVPREVWAPLPGSFHDGLTLEGPETALASPRLPSERWPSASTSPWTALRSLLCPHCRSPGHSSGARPPASSSPVWSPGRPTQTLCQNTCGQDTALCDVPVASRCPRGGSRHGWGGPCCPEGGRLPPAPLRPRRARQLLASLTGCPPRGARGSLS